MANESKDVTFTFSLPDRITVGQWEVYTEAEQEYIRKRANAKKSATPALMRFHGALALIRAGIAHVSPAGALDRYVDVKAEDQSGVDMAAVALIIKGVCDPFEALLENPLPGTASSGE